MKKAVVKSLQLGICFAVVSCVSNYKSPADASDSATIVANDRFRMDAMQHFSMLDESTCGVDRILYLANHFSRDAPKKITAGARVDIIATHVTSTLIGYSGTGVAGISEFHDCNSKISFTPVAGRTYEITMAGEIAGKCESIILDLETRRQPEDAVITNNYTCKKS